MSNLNKIWRHIISISLTILHILLKSNSRNAPDSEVARIEVQTEETNGMGTRNRMKMQLLQ
jgi:hypothetical protein